MLAGCSAPKDTSLEASVKEEMSQTENLQDETMQEWTAASEMDMQKQTAASEEVMQEQIEESEVIFNIENETENDLLAQITAEDLKKITSDLRYLSTYDLEKYADKGIIILDSVDKDTVLYGLCSGYGMLLRIGDEVFPISMQWRAPRLKIPEIYAQDFDQDGEIEYGLDVLLGTGSGLSVEQFYVIEREKDSIVLTEFAWEDWQAQILSHVSWNYDKEYNSVETFLDGEQAGATLFLGQFLEERQGTFQDLSFGDIAQFIGHDGQLYLWVEGGIFIEEWAAPVYECGIDVLVPVNYSADKTFTLGEIELSERQYVVEEEDTQETLPERVVNVMYADVTHDGVEDRIVTSISCLTLCEASAAEGAQEQAADEITPAQLLNQGEICYVRVYDGKYIETSYNEAQYAATGGYATECAIWQKELANAHVGNGQVFLLEQEGLAYLVEASDYFGQGAASYSYAVLSLDEERRIFTAKENAYSFDTNEGFLMQHPEDAYDAQKMEAYVKDFKTILDNAILLAATDVSKEPRITTEKNICTYDSNELRQRAEELQ